MGIWLLDIEKSDGDNRTMKFENAVELSQLIAIPSEQNYRQFFTARDKSYDSAFTYGGFANPCVDDGLREALTPQLAFKIIPFASKIAAEQTVQQSLEKAIYLLRSLMTIAETTELPAGLEDNLARIAVKLQLLSIESPVVKDIKRHYRIP